MYHTSKSTFVSNYFLGHHIIILKLTTDVANVNVWLYWSLDWSSLLQKQGREKYKDKRDCLVVKIFQPRWSEANHFYQPQVGPLMTIVRDILHCRCFLVCINSVEDYLEKGPKAKLAVNEMHCCMVISHWLGFFFYTFLLRPSIQNHLPSTPVHPKFFSPSTPFGWDGNYTNSLQHLLVPAITNWFQHSVWQEIIQDYFGNLELTLIKHEFQVFETVRL